VVEAHEFQTGDQKIRITVSLGVASIPNEDNARTTDELFQQADSALYYSKTKGRNRVTHFGDIASKIREEPSLIKI
jgi:diguanylate cyclase (GGDEF)-like protein